MQNSSILKLPIFKKYSYLTSESLNHLSQNFISYINALYIDTSDGIISGLKPSYDDKTNDFKISIGVFKINKEVYFLTSDAYIKRPLTEGRYALILDSKAIISDEYKTIESCFYFKEYDKVDENDFIIFNILLRDGANIYEEINSFNEFSKEFNQIDLTNQKYAIINNKKPSINPKILTKWAYEMLKFNLDNLDVSIIFNILNKNTSKDLIISYINLKLGLEIENENNSTLVKHLIQILNNKETKKGNVSEDNDTNKETFFVS